VPGPEQNGKNMLTLIRGRKDRNKTAD